MLSCVFEISWFFYGMENFKGIVTRNTVVKILTTIAVFAFVKERGDAWIYVLINSLSLLMGQLCLWPCGTLLMMISPAIVFYAASNILRNQYLLPKDMDRVFVTATVSASILNFVLNSIFIPVYGALGAVIGTVGAQFGELAYQALKTRKELPIKKYISSCATCYGS